MTLETALERLFTAFEAVETIVQGCDAQFGIRLIAPRRLLVYRKRLEPFVEQARLGRLPRGAVEELFEASEALDDPELWVENLEGASIRGVGVGKFKLLASAQEAFTEVALKAVRELPDEDLES